MNRNDRLVGILMQLQQHKQRRAEDLANHFEVSVRTIYRDIQALCETGVPVIAMTGQGYSLPDDFFLPPVNFTVEEAFMLILGSRFMAQNFDTHYADISQSAAQKIQTVLPKQYHEEIEYLQQNISVFASESTDKNRTTKLKQIRQAIMQTRRIRMAYTKRFNEGHQPEHIVRDVDPYSLAQHNNVWFLLAYCHLRQGMRVFRLSRIDELQILTHTFERPENLKQQWVRPSEARQLRIRVLVSWKVARWVQEVGSFFTEFEEETPEGLLITLRVEHERDVMQWLLSWGSNLEVLEPEHVRQAVFDEIKTMSQQYEKVKNPY